MTYFFEPSFGLPRAVLRAAILMFGVGLAHPVQAATLVVAPNGSDTTSPNCQPGPCRTISHAIKAANPGDTISIIAGTYSVPLETFPLVIDKDLFIVGAGAGTCTNLVACIDATGAGTRVMAINAGVTVTIFGVTITGGNLGNAPEGGGIRNAGTVTLNDSIVSGNTANGAGGIYTMGTLTLNNSTVNLNNGGNGVGGIYNAFGKLTLVNSTVHNNQAGGIGGIRNSGGIAILSNSTVSANRATQNQVGGIYNDCSGGGTDTDHFIATLILTNSTVSGNTAVTSGGGIVNESDKLRGCNGAVVTLNSSTVSGNTAGTYGGGVAQYEHNATDYPATITLKNSIVAGNTSTANNNLADCGGVITTQGHNLFGVNTGCPTGGTDIAVMNAGLGPLANSGGPTQTHVPQAGSAAVNAVPLVDCTDANALPISTDQRGVARPQGVACDIGSVEFQVPFEYAVKFVCGRAFPVAPNAPHPVAPGTYYTAINVHNPNGATINFNKKFARALPNQQAGPVTQFFPATLKADQAFEVECAEITNKLGMPPQSFVTGFAVFQSANEFDVVAVYTAATTPTGPVVTMHTERVSKRP
jgi:hypothetical protein